jgi:hypothetical protein
MGVRRGKMLLEGRGIPDQCAHRIGDYYARQIQQQEERQNRDARESFMAQQQQLSVNRPLKS